jgi:rare lipoprotein A
LPVAKPPAAKPAPPAAHDTQKPSPAAAAHAFAVQVAAFSTQDRAGGVAGKLGGHVSAAGRYWRVRLGPFPTRADAAAALAKAKAAGYSDARIQRVD